jgi:hypothetical protein
MDLHARDALPHLSSLLGVETWHLGHWHDSVTGTAMRKRDAGETEPEGVMRPVFGATLQGQDFHFSLLDYAEQDESLVFRFGMGQGGGNSTTTGGLYARQDRNWFTNGGIDVKATTPGHLPGIVDPEYIRDMDDLFAWIYAELMCNMQGYGDPDNWRSTFWASQTNAMHIQVYDSGYRATRLAAQVAAFGPDGRTGIDDLGPFKNSIDVDQNCAIDTGSTIKDPWLQGPW